MRVVVALGGNALQERGLPMTVQHQRDRVAMACAALAPLARAHELLITHGNGPQVGLLALQAAAYEERSEYPLDVLGAQTEGMIGYLIEQELGNLLAGDKSVAAVLTMTEVDPGDPAFADPTKFVGPLYTKQAARRLADRHGWVVKPDGSHWRRVVPSPLPRRIVELRAVSTLLRDGFVVISTGGGGIPTVREPGSARLVGVEAVIDKDHASAVLARDLRADALLIATDVDAVYADWGGPQQRAIAHIHPDSVADLDLPAGSMGPKVTAAAAFARVGSGFAGIGALADLGGLLAGRCGTQVSMRTPGVSWATTSSAPG